MKTLILRDKNVYPSPEFLESVLGKRYALLKELLDTVTGRGELDFEWRFYNDAKGWLGKATYRKKTVFWLSVGDSCFQTNFYFTEKTRGAVLDLDIDEKVKIAFSEAELAGKMVQLPLFITKKTQIKDVLRLVLYKKALK